MGLTTVPIEIASTSEPHNTVRVLCLVDSGAVLSVVPRATLESLGIEPLAKETFIMANGTEIEREKGSAVFHYDGRVGTTDVIFGEPGDMELIGVLTLEALGLSLDPLRRELKPIPMLL